MKMKSFCRLGVLALTTVGMARPAAGASAKELRDRYVALTQSWAKGIEFTDEEKRAMEAGVGKEKEMVKGPDDPLAKRILAAGEPSYAALAAAYPGKILDRTVLGTWSDPTKPLGKYNNEFSIYWNGAIAANLVQERHNTVVEFRVGVNEELPGKVRKNYSDMGYEKGYLPIVTGTYETGGVEYRQTAFAWKPEGQTEGWDVAFVEIEAANRTDQVQHAAIEARVMLMDGEARPDGKGDVTDGKGAVILAADGTAAIENGYVKWTFDLKPGERRRVVCKIPYLPDGQHLVKPASAAEFDAAHESAVKFWQGLLDEGATIQTPEGRVNNVWKALLLQNYILADGPRFTYGSGLWYNDNTYPQENGFGADTFAMYGHGAYADALEEWFVKMCVTPKGAGRKYQNRRAMPLHHLLETYRLTGRTDLWERHHDDFVRVAEEIIQDRHSTMVMEDGKKPLHWGILPPEKPGVDIQAATQRVYVLGHSITNCQGLADLGRFLVMTGIDRERGEKYLKEAADFRACILRAMDGAAIRVAGRPPFVDLQTLYFATTPDYGPTPYNDLGPGGRLQGTYYHYWVDMEFHYNFFNPEDQEAHWLADYVRARNGFVLGLTWARTQWGDALGWVNNVYDGGYYDYRLRCGDVDDFLLGLYAKLAFGMSRHLYVASEGSPLVEYNTKDGGFVGANYSFPNSAANSDMLLMLRNALVMEDLKGNVETGRLYLMKGAPKTWLEAGKQVRMEKMPTYFGEVSYWVESSEKGIRVTIEPPKGNWKEIELSLRVPVKGVMVNGEKGVVDQRGCVVIPHEGGRIVVEAAR